MTFLNIYLYVSELLWNYLTQRFPSFFNEIKIIESVALNLILNTVPIYAIEFTLLQQQKENVGEPGLHLKLKNFYAADCSQLPSNSSKAKRMIRFIISLVSSIYKRIDGACCFTI